MSDGVNEAARHEEERRWQSGYESHTPHTVVWHTKSDGPKVEQVPGGALRSSKAGKGRYDLISWHMLRRLAGVYERGAADHGDWNWTKGLPMGGCLSSALRHLDQWKAGETDEDHLAQAIWNIACLIHFDEEIRAGRLPAELRDAGPR